MSIQEQLMNDLKTAMKTRDTTRVSTLRMLRAQLKDKQIAKGEELTPDDEIAVLTNAAKKRKEAIGFYKNSDRKDLRTKEEAELRIISAYLPEQLTEDEIEAAVTAAISEVGASTIRDLGKVMAAVMQQLKGRADGKKVQEFARAKLS